MKNEKTAIERVKLRVAKGGHGVEETIIRSRFKKGLQLLDESFEHYDLVNVYHSITNKVNAVACIEPLKKQALYDGDKIPTEIASYLPNLLLFLNKYK